MRQKIQRCIDCDEPTGRSEDDSSFTGDYEHGPLCDSCYATYPHAGEDKEAIE